MSKTCGYCKSVILEHEDHWKVDEVSLHITLRPGATGDNKTDTCYWAYKHQRMMAGFAWPNTVFRIAYLALFFAVFPMLLHGEEVQDQKEWVKGGVYLGRSLSGDCLARPFVKVGEADDDLDTGEHQILGYEPGNVHVSRIDGAVIYERVKEKLFAALNRPFEKTACRCPPYRE